MNCPWGRCMQITVEVTSSVEREAELRGQPVAAFVKHLLDLGLAALNDSAQISSKPDDPDSDYAEPHNPAALRSAVERIRALRQPVGLSPAPRD